MDDDDSEFWSRHGIMPPHQAIRLLTSPALRALENARTLFMPALEKAPLPKETSGLLVRAFENLLDRQYEQAAAMITCLGTDSGAAAEVLARTVIEASFNILYITAEDHEERLFAYFYKYLQEHGKQLEEWRTFEETNAENMTVRPNVLEAIDAHRLTVKQLNDFVVSLAEGFGFKPPTELIASHWPRSLFKRCEQSGLKGDYYTSYHRLSASTHTSAEGTIHWLFGIYMLR
jgi:hypothetical protein